MSDLAQVHANLMGAARCDGDVNQGDARHVQRRRNACDGRSRAAGLRRHLLPVRWIAADGQVDSFPGLHDTPHERDVFLFNFPVVKLPGQLEMRAIVFCHDHEAGRPAIEAMHDARPQLTADAAQVVNLVEQGVDERALGVSGGRMHHHPRRFVDHDQVRILIDDV